MTFFKFLAYIIIMYVIFKIIDVKFKLVTRYENKEEQGFRRIINISSIASLVIFLLLEAFDKKISSIGIKEIYLQILFGMPFMLRYFIKSEMTGKEAVTKRNNKNKDTEVRFCYFCGSELDGSDICPSCSKKLEL